ncbi:putative 60S ribosomal protein L35-3 [Monocercomonoides exilis]|uniref:putative 60S ribosomal protein L35-3 n=1 Tax=Monocercomonoides exilis TaxID=2049356 RepID=UPI003559A538|nr:putative 60S ribosomal protein L35-3 [Monocercomonoides exilis]|eukprot:MONOS_4051.1-p1 / transcript=MONOS_4051.1 / gene=MONOS_4051 / organism=Monocercomonoides_exilis_PA203 / gene_product=60S ribosomal protein L35-3 / transcript_product=60S ribosomal protein L35-3 / location=Mono_scaffold00103:10846-11487(+) / protein_length=123 / sequence_SO=supercontig / SO=protein_coding / is_pseudo=false
MAPTNAAALRKLTKKDLLTQLKDLKKELLTLRISKVASSSPQNLSKIRVVKKSIARILTVMNQKQKASLVKFWKDKKLIPYDLRPKKTRAIRRQLTAKQLTKRTRRQQNKLVIKAKFAVRAK